MAVIKENTYEVNFNNGLKTNLVLENGKLQLEAMSLAPELIDVSKYSLVIYVDGKDGDDELGNGNLDFPYKTIQKAYSMINVDNALIYIISAGTYEISNGLQSILKNNLQLTYGVTNDCFGKVIFDLKRTHYNPTITMQKTNKFIGIVFKRSGSGDNRCYEYFYNSPTINLEFENCVFDKGDINPLFPIITGSTTNDGKVDKLNYLHCSFLTQFTYVHNSDSRYRGNFEYCAFKNDSSFTSQPNNAFSCEFDDEYNIIIENVNVNFGVYSGNFGWGNKFVYYYNGFFESNIIDLGNFFLDYKNLNLDIIKPQNSDIKIYTSTSNDYINFSEWSLVDENGNITSPQGRYIKIKIELIGNQLTIERVLNNFTKEESFLFQGDNQLIFDGSLRLKTEYTEPMNLDLSWTEEGRLFRQTIRKSNFEKIERIEIV